MSVATPGTEANGSSLRPDISADGRWVVFSSSADNLVTGGNGGHNQIYLHDRIGAVTTMLSVTAAGTPGNGDSTRPVISLDGRYVAFETTARNLFANDINGPLSDVVLLDRDSNGDGVFDDPEITLVSHTDGDATRSANDSSGSPSLSGDGRIVAFDSEATDLVTGFNGAGRRQVYVYNRFDNELVEAVSVNRNDGRACNRNAGAPRISRDARFVVFSSDATDLVANDDTNNANDVFRRDLAADQTVLVSLNADGKAADGISGSADISGDGALVVFHSSADDLVADDDNETRDVFLRNMATGATTMLSVTPAGGPGNGNSGIPAISLDGAWVAFETRATNLTNPPTNGKINVVLRDLGANATSLASRASDDTHGNHHSYTASISGDGAFVVFASEATNLISARDSGGPTDGNNRADIFARDIDDDKDGLPNVWETAGIDINFDGVRDLDLAALGCNPRHKDLLLEMDAMLHERPAMGPITDVINAFAAAPNTLVDNPDGRDGVRLRIDLDEDLPDASWAGNAADAWRDFNTAKGAHFGTVAQRGDPNAEAILRAKRRVYRYGIFAQRVFSGSTSGLAEVHGNDFMVTLGHPHWATKTPNDIAGTIMHEFGHTLGLRHGGADDINYKPNYHSIMSYTWQFPVFPGRFNADPNKARYAASWTLDFSRTAFRRLDEADLDEPDGIDGHAGHWVPVGPPLKNAAGVEGIYGKIEPERGAVDYNRDGDSTDRAEAEDLNRIYRFLTPSVDALEPHEDWSKLRYALYGQTKMLTADNSGQFGDAPQPEDEYPICPTWEDFDALDWIGWCVADYNADRSRDTRDVLDFLDDFQVRYPRTDFNQDGVINTLDVRDFLNAWNAGCVEP